MVNIKVDEGYAFDFLSILEVKKEKLFDHSAYILCGLQIKKQLGKELYDAIISSDYYKELVRVNKDIFNILERVREGELVTAKVVDDANTERYRLKKALQKEFFRTELAERKST